MKNRKFVVVAFLIVAVMLLGVGYAALTDTLDITGSADVNTTEVESEFDAEIYFSKAEAINPAGQTVLNSASVNADNNDKASFSAKSFVNKDDEAEFVFTIKNASDYDVVVTPKLNASLGNTNTEYFSIESDWAGASKTVPANSEITYTVTVTMIKNPTEAVSGSFLIELVAVADNNA